MQKGNIGVTTENIFPIIKKFLYSDHEIFLRELVSNAVDATQKLKTLASTGEFKGEMGDLTVHVNADKDKGTITITDRGLGLTADEIENTSTRSLFRAQTTSSKNTRKTPTPSSGTSDWDSTRPSWLPGKWKSSPALTRKARLQ